MVPVLLESDFVRTAEDTLENIETNLRDQIKVITGAGKDVPVQFTREPEFRDDIESLL